MMPPTHLAGEAVGGDEAGFSLIEIVLAVAIMGIGFVALLNAMATSALSSGLHRTQAVAEVELRRYAELVEAATWNTAGSYSIPPTVPTSAAVAAPYSLVADAPATTCAPVACGTAGVQTQSVTVAIHSADNKVQESVQIIKRVP